MRDSLNLPSPRVYTKLFFKKAYLFTGRCPFGATVISPLRSTCELQRLLAFLRAKIPQLSLKVLECILKRPGRLSYEWSGYLQVVSFFLRYSTSTISWVFSFHNAREFMSVSSWIDLECLIISCFAAWVDSLFFSFLLFLKLFRASSTFICHYIVGNDNGVTVKNSLKNMNTKIERDHTKKRIAKFF